MQKLGVGTSRLKIGIYCTIHFCMLYMKQFLLISKWVFNSINVLLHLVDDLDRNIY